MVALKKNDWNSGVVAIGIHNPLQLTARVGYYESDKAFSKHPGDFFSPQCVTTTADDRSLSPKLFQRQLRHNPEIGFHLESSYSSDTGR